MHFDKLGVRMLLLMLMMKKFSDAIEINKIAWKFNIFSKGNRTFFLFFSNKGKKDEKVIVIFTFVLFQK